MLLFLGVGALIAIERKHAKHFTVQNLWQRWTLSPLTSSPLQFILSVPKHLHLLSLPKCTLLLQENRDAPLLRIQLPRGVPSQSFISQRMYLGWGDSEGRRVMEEEKVVSCNTIRCQNTRFACGSESRVLFICVTHYDRYAMCRTVPIWRLNYHPIQLTQSSSWPARAVHE